MQWTPERLPVAGTPCPRCRSRAVSACPHCSHTAWAVGVRRPFPLALRGGFLGVVGIRGSAGQSALSRTRVCTPCVRHPSDVLPPPVPVQGCAGHSATLSPHPPDLLLSLFSENDPVEGPQLVPSGLYVDSSAFDRLHRAWPCPSPAPPGAPAVTLACHRTGDT